MNGLYGTSTDREQQLDGPRRTRTQRTDGQPSDLQGVGVDFQRGGDVQRVQRRQAEGGPLRRRVPGLSAARQEEQVEYLAGRKELRQPKARRTRRQRHPSLGLYLQDSARPRCGPRRVRPRQAI